MKLMVVRVSRVLDGMASTKRLRLEGDVRAAAGRWTCMCVTKGDVVYATKRMGMMPHRAT
jgi:phage/plasmid primase-like uncharacterized protein